MASYEELAKEHRTEKSSSAPFTGSEEETTNPFGNNTEEKAPNSNSLSEEYLHNFLIISHSYTEISQYHKLENADAYIAFHGELLVPPPNVL